MKANLPKSFSQLRKSEQDRILDEMERTMDAELCEAQFVWLKMACCILHDMGVQVDDLMLFIGGWQRMYRVNARFPDKQAQGAFLESRLAEIFGEGGFPEEFMQNFRKIGR